MAVVNFPPRQIGPVRSEVLTLGAADEEGRVILLAPDADVPLGSRIPLSCRRRRGVVARRRRLGRGVGVASATASGRRLDRLRRRGRGRRGRRASRSARASAPGSPAGCVVGSDGWTAESTGPDGGRGRRRRRVGAAAGLGRAERVGRQRGRVAALGLGRWASRSWSGSRSRPACRSASGVGLPLVLGRGDLALGLLGQLDLALVLLGRLRGGVGQDRGARSATGGRRRGDGLVGRAQLGDRGVALRRAAWRRAGPRPRPR